MSSYKKHYSNFINQNPACLHFAAHSHHFWPDCTRQAQLDYWDDSAKFVDEKWSYFFNKKLAQLKSKIAKEIGHNRPNQIVFAPNTHEFVLRILSCLPLGSKPKILTTDSEFYSFSRQLSRLEEDNEIDVTYIPTNPIHTFEQRFIEASHNNYDLIFCSHVFFNSGYAIQDLNSFVSSLPEQTFKVIDGYHAFMALPIDLNKLTDKIFYIGGGYKYAQAGEGICFMSIPFGLGLRPRNTGWFAQIGSLGAEPDRVAYSNDGMSFAGATMDFTGAYRLLSVFNLYSKEDISTLKIHSHVIALQLYFIDKLSKAHHAVLKTNRILWDDNLDHGHFLTFECDSEIEASTCASDLKSNNIIVDYRGNCLRFGFAIYHDKSDIDELIRRI